MEDLKNISINQLPDINKIGDNKKKHLISMIPYLIDNKYQEFYSNLTILFGWHLACFSIFSFLLGFVQKTFFFLFFVS